MGVPVVERMPSFNFHVGSMGCSPSLVIKVQSTRPLARRSVFLDSSAKTEKEEITKSARVAIFMLEAVSII